ncbi:MAG: hypothetical protein HQK84_03030 [Nitrospinae bacterium]|nr:hypothetical protein [Nitrospinota bacterium]
METDERKNDRLRELREILEAQNFTSIEEARRFANALTKERNEAPKDDFQGLSSSQMSRLLYAPFDSPNLLSYSNKMSEPLTAPIVTLFHLLVKDINDNGLKATAKGNLPRNLCQDIALQYWGENVYKERVSYFKINKEEDFFELHIVRTVAELSGLIRKQKGSFFLTKKCRTLLVTEKPGELFFLLYKTYVTSFNWGYWDGFEEFDLIQGSFLYTLYLIHLHGSEWQPGDFYFDCFIKAFPVILNEVPINPYRKPLDYLKSCYLRRAFINFVGFFGFGSVEQIKNGKLLPSEYRIKKLPLFDQFVHFHV